MNLFMITCILKWKKISLPYIIIKSLIKVWSNKDSTLVYSYLFTKLFEREKIKLNDEIEKIVLRVSYDIYSKKTLGIMYMVKRSGGWDFRNPTKKGNPDTAKVVIPKAPKKALK